MIVWLASYPKSGNTLVRSMLSGLISSKLHGTDGSINLKKLSYYSDSNIRDSRDKNYKLNYLSGENKLKEIKDCEVINLKDNKEELIKLKDLL